MLCGVRLTFASLASLGVAVSVLFKLVLGHQLAELQSDGHTDLAHLRVSSVV
jgi:hypothetical protein